MMNKMYMYDPARDAVALDELRRLLGIAIKKDISMPIMTEMPAASWGYFHAPKKINEAQDELIEKLQALHREGVDLSPIKNKIDRMETEAREAIVRDLRGMASLAKRSMKPGKLFVLAIWYENKSRIIEGVDFAYGERIAKDKVENEFRVFLRDNDVVSPTFHTVVELTENLTNNQIPWHLSYLDD